jgi:hypothetical protein
MICGGSAAVVAILLFVSLPALFAQTVRKEGNISLPAGVFVAPPPGRKFRLFSPKRRLSCGTFQRQRRARLGVALRRATSRRTTKRTQQTELFK